MGILKVNNLLVRSNVGFDPHLSHYQQDLLINLEVEYNSFVEEESDDPGDAFDIQQLIKEINGRAETGHFNLLEAFTRMVLNTTLEFARVEKAIVEVKKVQSIQFSGELSFTLSGSKR